MSTLASLHYRKVERKKFPQSVKKITIENQYWNEFKTVCTDTFHQNVPFVRFSNRRPFSLQVCSNLDLRLMRCSNLLTFKKLGFETAPLCCDIRRDSSLLAVGGQKGFLRLYNNSITSGLDSMRSLKGHQSDVYDCKWQPSNYTRLLSFSNDCTVRYWDIIQPKEISKIKGHKDFIRSGDWLPLFNATSNGQCFISGGYDHYCKVWDLRALKRVFSVQLDYDQISHEPQMSFNHGFPVEDCLAITNTDMIAVAGQASVTIWSVRKMNKPIAKIDVHSKLVTCLAVNEQGSRLLTGCLDMHVRVFHTTAIGDTPFQNTHTFKTPSAVLSMDMSSNDMCIAISTIKHGIILRARNGFDEQFDEQLKNVNFENDPISKYDNDIRSWMLNRKKLRYMTEAQASGEEKYIRYASKDWVIRGQKQKLPISLSMNQRKLLENELRVEDLTPTTMVVQFKNRNKMKKYDIALKQFRYADALECAIRSRDTLVMHSVLEDLWRRHGLEIALGGKDASHLMPILEYLIYAIPHPHLTATCIHVSALVIDLYQPIIGQSIAVDYLFKQLTDTVNDMILKYKILLKTQGTIDMILAAQDTIANPLPEKSVEKMSLKLCAMMKKTKSTFGEINRTKIRS